MMGFRIKLTCWDGVERHYYTTVVEEENATRACQKARAEYAKSIEFPDRLKGYSLEERIEEPNIQWCINSDRDKYLYPDDFKYPDCSWKGQFANIAEINRLIEFGAIVINREKLDEYWGKNKTEV